LDNPGGIARLADIANAVAATVDLTRVAKFIRMRYAVR
jgi:hypothetical protein